MLWGIIREIGINEIDELSISDKLANTSSWSLFVEEIIVRENSSLNLNNLCCERVKNNLRLGVLPC